MLPSESAAGAAPPIQKEACQALGLLLKTETWRRVLAS